MDLRVCEGCDKKKPAIAFAINRGKHRRICKQCQTAKKRIREAARKADPEQNHELIRSTLNAALRMWRGPVSDGDLTASE